MTIIGNDVLQAGVIAKLKVDANLIARLGGNDGGVKEDQYQGTRFTYPATRVDIQRQEPMNEAHPCTLSNLFFTVRVYAEGTSSKPCDEITALVAKALHRKQIVDDPVTFRIAEVLYNGMFGATKTDDRLWMGTVIFTGNVYPATN